MASRIRFVLNRPGVRALLDSGGIVDSYLRDVADHVAQVARRTAPRGPERPKRTESRMRDSIYVTPRRGRGFAVVVNVSYALMVHNGTKPHVIVPRRASVLRWKEPTGAVVFARRVNHPGTAANPFLLRSLQQVVTNL